MEPFPSQTYHLLTKKYSSIKTKGIEWQENLVMFHWIQISWISICQKNGDMKNLIWHHLRQTIQVYSYGTGLQEGKKLSSNLLWNLSKKDQIG